MKEKNKPFYSVGKEHSWQGERYVQRPRGRNELVLFKARWKVSVARAESASRRQEGSEVSASTVVLTVLSCSFYLLNCIFFMDSYFCLCWCLPGFCPWLYNLTLNYAYDTNQTSTKCETVAPRAELVSQREVCKLGPQSFLPCKLKRGVCWGMASNNGTVCELAHFNLTTTLRS